MKQSYLYMLSNMMPCQLERELKKWEQKAKLNPDVAENREVICCIEGLMKTSRRERYEIHIKQNFWQ